MQDRRLQPGQLPALPVAGLAAAATVFIALELGRRVPNLDLAEHAHACLWPEDGSARRAQRLRVRRLRTVWRRLADLPIRH
jgi:hypothetical protein